MTKEDLLEEFENVEYRMGEEGSIIVLMDIVHLMKLKMKSFIN
jgi:hypothetical protein